jgi:hypothetical protein
MAPTWSISSIRSAVDRLASRDEPLLLVRCGSRDGAEGPAEAEDSAFGECEEAISGIVAPRV